MRKRPFKSKKLAREVATRVMREFPGRQIRVYRCAYKKDLGEHYHLTSQAAR